jgi:hypothetical protein
MTNAAESAASPIDRLDLPFRVTPELALVDPELGRRLRLRHSAWPLRMRPPLPVLRLVAGGDAGTSALEAQADGTTSGGGDRPPPRPVSDASASAPDPPERRGLAGGSE